MCPNPGQSFIDGSNEYIHSSHEGCTQPYAWTHKQVRAVEHCTVTNPSAKVQKKCDFEVQKPCTDSILNFVCRVQVIAKLHPDR